MIKKIKFIKNLGKFYYFSCRANELDLHKNTFIFAPNAYGKSTLVNLFRSLRDNDANVMRARKTLNAHTQPEAVIIIDGENYVFNGTEWNKTYKTIQIFDMPFIQENILAHEIVHEHRKNIHRIIIGAQGVKLAQELTALKESEKTRHKHLDILIATFSNAEFVHSFDSFLSISDTEEEIVGSRIQKLEQDIKSKESESQIKALENPTFLAAPMFDLVGLKTIASQKIPVVHEAAEERVRVHIQKNFKNNAQAMYFIRHGLDFIQADCPFCGQDLKNASNLLTAYQQYFDDVFRAYQKNIAIQTEAFAKWNLDNDLTMLVSTHNANVGKVKQWEPFIGTTNLIDVDTLVACCRPKLAELKVKVQAELEKKLKDSKADIDLTTLDFLATELAGLKAAIETYNDVLTAFTAKAKVFIKNLPIADVDSIRRALVKEQEIEKRFKAEWKIWAKDCQATKNNLEVLRAQKNAKQKELEDYTKAIFASHQKRINELLLTLGADFEITDLAGKTDERANEVYSDFAFLILQKRVPIRATQEDAPSFKNTLSEGDKSTLAFSFFVAALEKLPELDKQIVIFDDPLSSLDENRRHSSAVVLFDLSPKFSQLFVYTHKKDFLRMLFDKMPDNKVLQIRSDKTNGSRLESFDVEEDRKGDYERIVDEMERYIEEDFGPRPETIQGNIRNVFETVLKTKYYLHLAEDIKAKHGFAVILTTLFNSGFLDEALKPRLFDLCSVTSGPHHGEIVDAQAKKLTRDELIPLIREAFALLQRV